MQSTWTSVASSWPTYKPVKAGMARTTNHVLEIRSSKRQIIDLAKVMQEIYESQIHYPVSRLGMSTCLRMTNCKQAREEDSQPTAMSKVLAEYPRIRLMTKESKQDQASRFR